MDTISSQTGESLAESMFALSSANLSGEAGITFQLLINAVQVTTEDRDECIRTTIGQLLDMRMTNVLETVATCSIDVTGGDNGVPFTPAQIIKGEAGLRLCSEQAIAELERLLIPAGDESDEQISASLAIAIAYCWGFQETGYYRFCQAALQPEPEILRLNRPEPKPGEIN